MSDKIFQIQVVLRGSKPKIWRRLLIPSGMPLPILHEVIQVSMGWENSHLHHFIKDNIYYTVKYDSDELDEVKHKDYKDLIVSDLLLNKHDRVIYVYDLGDNWEHDIFLEEITERDPLTSYPICIDGKMSCPPENCGGINGYHKILEIIKNPEHKYYENYIDWLAEDFDPEYFNLEEVNYLLQSR